MNVFRYPPVTLPDCPCEPSIAEVPKPCAVINAVTLIRCANVLEVVVAAGRLRLAHKGRPYTRPQSMDDLPFVSIVMPVRNESAHLERAFEAINAQSYPPHKLEVLVVDGGSTDETADMVRTLMRRDERIRLLGGPGVNTPRAMELGRSASRGDLILKLDGHGWINDRFIEAAASTMMQDRKVGCVGGLIEPVAETVAERAIAVARFSRFGVGGGVYTLKRVEQVADTVQCGVYRAQALSDAGGFDPELPFGEDEELNFRLRQQGWQIRVDPRMSFHYRVRPSITALLRQYFRYGRARVAVVRKHPGFFRPKYAMPAGATLSLFGTAPGLAWPSGRRVPAVIWTVYLAFVAAGAAYLSVRHRFARPDLIALSLIAIHLGYGLGSLTGIANAAFRRTARSAE